MVAAWQIGQAAFKRMELQNNDMKLKGRIAVPNLYKSRFAQRQ